MTREQDFERRLADWLSDGPSTAPTEVVDEALATAATRPQRSPAWVRARSWLEGTTRPLSGARQRQRLAVLVATVLLLVALALMTALPFAGGAAPEMDPLEVRPVEGISTLVDESAGSEGLVRVSRIEAGDPRIDGTARHALVVEDAAEAGLQRSAGVMRLENDWGAWEGVINGVRYPDGTHIEYGWLTGEGAYAGFNYFHSTRDHPAEAERALEGAIWPGEPPPMPGPSLLQADPLG